MTMGVQIPVIVLSLDGMCCAEKVNQLLNHPIMSHFGTQMSGTST
jgi:hypothetical protein